MIPFGYIRVSGKGQVDGDGPERQKQAITDFCHQMGLGDPQFFKDLGVSGTTEAMERDQFMRMIETIRHLRKETRGLATGCIVAEKQDRLARTLLVQEILLKECFKFGIPVYSVEQGALTDLADDKGEPTKKALRQIMGVIAELDKDVLCRRLRVARERKRLAYGRCEGARPFGSSPGEKRLLARMNEYRTQGLSFQRIADQLNQLHSRTRKGVLWTRGAVYQAMMHRGVKQLSSVDEKEPVPIIDPRATID